jgi:hypothetical protein
MKIGLSQRVLLHKNRAYDALEQGWYTYFKSHTLFPIANRPKQNFEALDSSFDKRVVFYILSVSNIVLICNKGEINKGMQDILKLAIDCIS